VLFLTEHQAILTYWGIGGIAPHIFNLGTRYRWVVRFTPRPLYPQGKSLLYPPDSRLGGTQSRSGSGDEEKNSQPRQDSNPPIIQLVADRYTTELTQILCMREAYLKIDLNEKCCGLNWSGWEWNPVADFCEHDNALRGSITAINLLTNCALITLSRLCTIKGDSYYAWLWIQILHWLEQLGRTLVNTVMNFRSP
jgi:hypothetical protein